MKNKSLKKVFLSSVLIIALTGLYLVNHALIERVKELDVVKNYDANNSMVDLANENKVMVIKTYDNISTYFKSPFNGNNVSSRNDKNITTVSIPNVITIGKENLVSGNETNAKLSLKKEI